MAKKKQNTQKMLNFKEFVLQDLKKEERIKNVLSIIFQDFYLFMARISQVDDPVWAQMGSVIDQFVGEDDKHLNEGQINRAKDKLIRELVVLEEMRQYYNFIEKQGK